MFALTWIGAPGRAKDVSLSLLYTALVLFASGSTLPTKLQAGESDGLTQATGRLMIVVSDDFAGGLHERIHYLEDALNQRVLRLRFDGSPPPGLSHGMMLTVQGVLDGNEIYLAANGNGNGSTTESSTSASTTVTGEQSTLVMLASFSNTALTCSADYIRDQVFGDPATSVDGLYQEISYGETWLAGEAVGPYQLDFTEDGCDYIGWANAIDDLARADGHNPDQYARKVYVLPKNTCPASGIGTLGGMPSRAWTFRCDIPDVLGHELGHNLGMSHASMPSGEYDDKSDVMGLATRKLRQINAPHKEQMGWLSGLQLENVTASGYYDVAPLELDGQAAVAAQALKISKPDTNETYYLSYRRPLGFDINLSTQLYLDQLSIHRWSGASNTYLMAVLPDGDSFVDVFNGVTVRQVGHTDQYATVHVEFDGGSSNCHTSQPSMVASPTSQSGTPGTSLSYSVTVTNEDSGDCAASSFLLETAAPLEWQATLSDDLMLLAPGETAQTAMSVTSPATAVDGSVGVDVSVLDQLDPSRTTTASVTYAVATSPDTEPPTTPSGLSASVKGKQVELSWSPSNDNVGVQGYQILRDGSIAATTSDTMYADRDSSGSGTVYNVVAFDAAGNLSAPSSGAVATKNGSSGNGKGKQK
jgi:hypothetical protein